MLKHLYRASAGFLVIMMGLPGRSMEPLPAGVWTPPTWSLRRAEFERHKIEDRGAVVFYGDSITEGWTTLAADFSGMRTVNRGIYGDLASNIKFRIKEDVIDLEPKAVVMLIGTNDVKDGRPALDIVNDIENAAKAVHNISINSKIIICELMPRSPRPGMDQEKKYLPGDIPKVNLLIDRIPSRLPYIYVCDTFHPLAINDSFPNTEDFVDGVHPNLNGYKKWKAALIPLFRSIKLLPVLNTIN